MRSALKINVFFKGLTALISACLTVVILSAVLHLFVKSFRAPFNHWENTIGMWVPENTIGWINKKNFTGYCLGNILVKTDEYGFRFNGSLHRRKKEDKKRVFFLGDSVTWGVGVNQEDSFSGYVTTLLDKPTTKNVEIFNGGVVGYSTFQEYLYLKNYISGFDPDIVVINLCYNDFLPTEDPFHNIRAIHIEYLLDLIDSGYTFTEEELGSIQDLIRIFKNTDKRAWDQINYDASQKTQKLCLKAFIDLPLNEMVTFCNRNKIELVYLLIPSQAFSGDHRFFFHYFKQILDTLNVKYIDVTDELMKLRTPGVRNLETHRSTILERILPKTLYQDYNVFMTWRAFRKTHKENIFFDPHHPSRRGNKIIAEAILESGILSDIKEN